MPTDPAPPDDRQPRITSTALRALDCLAEIALDKGLDDVSMRDVARRLGISLAALQHHYPTKAALFDAFVRQSVEFYRQRIAEVVAASVAGSRFADIVRFVAGETVGSARASTLTMIEARAHHDADTRKAMNFFMTAYLGMLAEAIAADFPALPPQDALLCATLVCAQLEGLAGALEAAQQLGVDPQRVLAEVQQVVISMPERFVDGNRSEPAAASAARQV